jgi:hypothetical protein
VAGLLVPRRGADCPDPPTGTVLNLKTAKALDLDVPASVLARATAVIE